MRIIKYIFLLIILAMVALTVFVATQKGEFNITKSRIINSPKAVVYNYVNDFRNWENWSSWKADDSVTQFSYFGPSSGIGAGFSWEGTNSEGSLKTNYIKDNDSLAQTMIYNGSPTRVTWAFKDTVGGTKVTWRAKGKLDFMSKVYATAKGGGETIFSNMFEQSLANLDHSLDYEINTFSVKLGGIVRKSGVMYLKQTITSTIANAPKNKQIMLSKMLRFFKKNDIPMNGKPFVIYHSNDVDSGITRFSVCVPIREEIFTSAGSDITFGQLPLFRAVKITLNGDYSHRDAALKKGAAYLRENNLQRLDDFRSLEILTKSMQDVKGPSKWVTDIYIPIRDVTPAPTPVRIAAPVQRAPSTPAAASPDESAPQSESTPD